MNKLTENNSHDINRDLNDDKLKDIYEDISVFIENHRDIELDTLIFHSLKFVIALNLLYSNEQHAKKIIALAIQEAIELLANAETKNK